MLKSKEPRKIETFFFISQNDNIEDRIKIIVDPDGISVSINDSDLIPATAIKDVAEALEIVANMQKTGTFSRF